MRKTIATVSVGWVAICTVWSQTATPLISGAEVAGLFEYPGTVERQDTSAAAHRRNPGVIWEANYVSPDDGLAVTSITLAQGKTILTDTLRLKYEKASRNRITLPDGQNIPPMAKPIALEGGAEGFVYVAGFGPGGSAYGAAVTSPNGAFDVSINIAFSSSISSAKIDQLQARYDALARNKKGGILELLESVIATIYPRIAANYDEIQRSPPSFTSSLPSPGISTSAIVLVPSITPNTVTSGKQAPREASSRGGWIVGTTIAFSFVVCVGLALIYLRMNRKRKE